MQDLVSVIIPAYNSEKTIQRCINSVLEQTYDRIEIIVIDDGSLDGTPALCDEMALSDRRISVVHTVNGGVSRARNKGIDLAAGQYLTFVDSDDYIDSRMIEELLSAVTRDGADLGAAYLTKPLKDSFCISVSKKDREKIFLLLKNYTLFGPVQKLYSRELIQKGKIRFKDNYSYGEDLLFNLDYLCLAENISYVNRCFYHYDRTNADSLSQRNRWDMFDNDMALHRALSEWLKKKEIAYEETDLFLENRIADTAYNSVCLTFEKGWPYKSGATYRYLERICSDKCVREVFKKREVKAYAPWIMSAVRNRQPLVLLAASRYLRWR